MADGINIAAEVITPSNAPDGLKMPTILAQTRYWRAHSFRWPFRHLLGDQIPMVQEIIDVVTSHGFAVVYTDVRGTGASTGTWRNANTEKEFSDCKQIMDWIVKQPWSDGNVITWGISYLGLTAEFAAIHHHPALRGVMPMHDYWDVLADVGAPGGIPNARFLELWSDVGRSLDRNSVKDLAKRSPLAVLVANHVKPVDDDKKGIMVKAATKQHEKNVYPFDLTTRIKFRDDPIDADGTCVDSMCVYKYKGRIEGSGVPYYYWGSWLDAGTADAAFTRFLNINNRQRVVIGDWNHGARVRSNQYHPGMKKVVPSTKDQYTEWINYFDRCLKFDVPDEKAIYYFTLAEEKWKKTCTWPPLDHEMKSWFFAKKNGLTVECPEDETGEDVYQVDFSATTGKFNRWGAGLGYRIVYPDRGRADKKLLVYTSKPMTGDVEITGNGIATVHLSTTHEDGIIIVYLEDVDPSGRVTYITEGLLRLIHRKLATEALPYTSTMQFHSFLRTDCMPMKPGEIAEVKIGLLSTSTLVRAGHSIRVAIAGADEDSFPRIPDAEDVALSISRNVHHPSRIQLPIIAKTGGNS